MLVSVGSGSNIDDPDTHPREFSARRRAEVHADGKLVEVYAHGIRTAWARPSIHHGELWCSTNERDALGNNLPPDYVTHIQEGGFYGWPWYYIGSTKTRGCRSHAPMAPGQSAVDPAPITEDQAKNCQRVDWGQPSSRRTCWCNRTWLRWGWYFIQRGRAVFRLRMREMRLPPNMVRGTARTAAATRSS